ncbi:MULTISPECIES: hypothetical protein [Photorhabdus]|nr:MULTISPECIES: hypothetical protein [Photorhabdus]
MTGVSECSQQRSNLKDDGYSIISVVRVKVSRCSNAICSNAICSN